ncbi:hypothetical protein GOODEAATRI_028058 [Goodea atripinnis]|uniref:Uncharacterized protein n=1 Tax=Goodea atripinnis TaxID=208336 RepID=A0ABV0NF62_9TELE
MKRNIPVSDTFLVKMSLKRPDEVGRNKVGQDSVPAGSNSADLCSQHMGELGGKETKDKDSKVFSSSQSGHTSSDIFSWGSEVFYLSQEWGENKAEAPEALSCTTPTPRTVASGCGGDKGLQRPSITKTAALFSGLQGQLATHLRALIYGFPPLGVDACLISTTAWRLHQLSQTGSGCGDVGHLIRACPGKNPPVNNTEQWRDEGGEKTPKQTEAKDAGSAETNETEGPV